MSMTGQQFARQGALKGGLIGAAGLGTAGALFGSTKHNRVTGEERTKKQRVIGGLLGGLMGAGFGFNAGVGIGHDVNAIRWNRGHRPTPDWLSGVKTKAEGRKAFRALARQHHPDLGGDPAEFRKIIHEWEAHEPMLKKAMYAAFADEIEKIASVGAMLGGYAGYRLSPNTLAGKATGVVGGALAGHMVGQGLSGAKRVFYDQQKERDRADLYGYTSPPPEPTNFR